MTLPSEFTLQDLRQYNGTDPNKPILLAVKGIVYDVSSKADMYGPGKAYNCFVGKDATRMLAKSSLKVEDNDPEGSTEGLTASDLKTLGEWEAFYARKYKPVGKVVKK